jgi:hypothetical protein
MSFNYGPNYLSLIQALQEGGTSTAKATKSARESRGLGVSSAISSLGKVIDEPQSTGQAILARFEKVKKDNDSLKEKVKELGIEQDPVTEELELEEEVTTTETSTLADFDPSMIDIALGALSDVESKGSGGYEAIGPLVTKGMYKDQRAYGKYQVMEGNIGPWTEKYYGEKLSKEEFLANPEAQDAVAENVILANWEKYGSIEDAVSVWFTGRPYKKAAAAGAKDENIGVPEYLEKWRNNYDKRYNESLGDDS